MDSIIRTIIFIGIITAVLMIFPAGRIIIENTYNIINNQLSTWQN